MDAAGQKRAAREFVKRWQNMPCVEEEHSRSFWIELAHDVLGIPDPTRVLEFERKVGGRKIDVFYEDMGILIEQKSRGVSLDKTSERSKKAGEETPFEQAKWYADNLPGDVRPRWIVTCNFDEFRIYDLYRSDFATYVSFTLSELPDQSHLLSFFLDRNVVRVEREEDISVKAGERVGELYNALAARYHHIDDDPHEQRSLNILMVRLIFLLYAEDSGIFNKDALLRYLKPFDVGQMRMALIQLFSALDTPEEARGEYLDENLAAFPYVNGGLFGGEDIVVPQFDNDIRLVLLSYASGGFDWSRISPTIFGAVFESTLNPATRREGGMHYTSPANIHKVIDPLFLDDLEKELAGIEAKSNDKTRAKELRTFQNKLASLRIFDPACGSGNFLTESYLSLRALENRVLEDLNRGQSMLALAGEASPIKVSIGQFFGIEINDFAVSVAKTALWIAEEQMMAETEEIVNRGGNAICKLEFLPLTTNDNIHCGNALATDWDAVLPAAECSYIVGNPPLVGYSNHTPEQTRDREALFGRVKTVDYVACWYKKAAAYMRANKAVRAAFVSTNSICQGQQVQPIWQPLFEEGISIDFAHKTFVWNSEASDQAHVHVVIVGFSYEQAKKRVLFEGGVRREAAHINGYLADAGDVFVVKRSAPLCNAPEMGAGGKPTDGGFLLLSTEEKDELLHDEPGAEPFIRPFSMGAEFINGKDRWCLWMEEINPAILVGLPALRERVRAVREFRLKSKKAATRKKADTPWLFDEVRPPKGENYIAVPAVSSERRHYVPLGFVENGMIPGNQLYFISNGSLYVFGILCSQFHNAWMRTVCGRLKSDYRYTNTIVYNNFPWPGATAETLATPVEELVAPEVRARVEACAQELLDAHAFYVTQAREAGAACSLADMYDPDNDFLYPRLVSAHRALDEAVEAAYGVAFAGDEEAIVAHLFTLYAALAT